MTLVKGWLDAGIGAGGDEVAGSDACGVIKGEDERDGAVKTRFGDDERAKGTTITAHITDGTGAEAAVVSAIQDNQIRRAGRNDRDDRSLAIRLGRTQDAKLHANRGSGDKEGGQGEDVAHGSRLLGFLAGGLGVLTEGARRGELSELMTNHIFRHIDCDKSLTVMDFEV